MLSHCPSISDHAFDRAAERLKLSDCAFWAWVRATYRDWMPVNAQYLHDRGLKTSSQNARHFVCPWTPRETVALCLANTEDLVKTVMTFSTGAKPAPETPALRAAGRLLRERKTGEVLRLLAGVTPAGDMADEALLAFADGRFDLKDLQKFFSANAENRQRMLKPPPKPLSDAEKKLITRA